MKRILSCILIILLLFTSAYAYFDDAVDSDCTQQINFLTALGIFTGYEDGMFHPENTLTRAELVTVLMRTMRLGDVSIDSYTYYADIDAQYWALSSINAATTQGIINGYEDGTFRPDETVTIAETVKTVVCALGYGAIAEASGGYPSGYMAVAAKNKLTDGVNGKFDDGATRADTAKILYAALKTDIAETTGDGKYEITDKTILDDVLDVHEREGVVTATKIASLVPTDELDDDEITVDSVVYKINDDFLQELAGYKLTFYVRERTNGDAEIVYYEVDTPESAALWVAAEDVLSGDKAFSLSNFVYYENDKRTTVKTNLQYVSYNGESTPATVNLFDISDGNVLLIDSDDDGTYETAFINSGATVVVDRINKNDRIISDKIVSGRKIDLMPEKNVREVNIISNGKSVAFNLIKPGDIITYSESLDGKRATAVVSSGTIDGVVGEIADNSGSYDIYIGTDKYTIRGSAYDKLSDDGTLAAIAPGVQVKIYLDAYSNAAYVEIMGKSNEKYGVVIAAASDGGIDTTMTLRIFPESGDVTDIELSDKVSVRTGYTSTLMTPAETVAALGAAALDTSDTTFAMPLYQLVKYNTGEDGKIVSLSIAAESGTGLPLRDAGQFVLDFKAESFRTNQKDIINAVYLMDSSTKIFVVPEERDEFEDYSHSISLTKSMNMKIGLYDIDDVNHAGAALIIYPKVDESGSGNYYDNSIYTAFFTARDMRKAVDDKGNTVFRQVGVGNNGEMTVDFKTDPSFNVGDIYQFVRVNGKVVKKNLIFDGASKEFKYAETNNYGYGLSTGDQNPLSADWWNRLMTDAAIGYLNVVKITGTKVIMTDGEREYMFNILPAQSRFTMYDSSETKLENKVKTSSLDELEVGDNVVVRTHTLNIGDIVIVR